jgi:hypothetical protein
MAFDRQARREMRGKRGLADATFFIEQGNNFHD